MIEGEGEMLLEAAKVEKQKPQSNPPQKPPTPPPGREQVAHKGLKV